MIRQKIGYPRSFIDFISSFHEGMSVEVLENGPRSRSFQVTSGTKQGCVLASLLSLLFNIYFAAILGVTFKNNDNGS